MKNYIALCYGSISFFINILHNIFLIYHVDVFLNVYKIDKTSFWVGEIIFLIWNSLNDPIFGWISDRKYLSNDHEKNNSFNIIANRLNKLHINGPLLSITFIFFWLSWSFPAIQFVVCLCLYDGFLTMIDLHHSALLADLSISTEIRTKLNMHCSVFSALGSMFVFVSYAVWDKDNFFPFQKFCFLVAIIAFFGFYASVKLMKNELKHSTIHEKIDELDEATTATTTLMRDNKDAMKCFIKQLSGQSNFLWFTAMNLVQVFHCHFNSNFFPMFLTVLLGEKTSPFVCSLLLGVSFIAPHLNNIYFLILCRKYGAYDVIKYLFILKLSFAILVFFCGGQNVWLLAFFIASNRIFTEGTCKLLNLVITDLVDEDVVINQRSNSVSALMFGVVAFLSKPGQTMAPVIGTVLLSTFTGRDIFQTRTNEMRGVKNIDIISLNHQVDDNGNVPNIAHNSDTAYTNQENSYQDGVFNLLIIVPVMCAILQLFFWFNFTLHGKKLSQIKTLRASLKFVSV
ncbi:hypothetical protein HELRODRAFT_112249 [Helobdella robusta]|uniref:Transmembrane protein 180 n=1 Tax=Helobdella robusta TaxID=6412 RepID=T1EFI1_HELRO|nr:hypothetical protein HELRODRAFT_112249 [Helobdella robusta]ESO03349.1 hypothetical protein HELRODRAFT_112249 [Helobdella robusta]